MAPDYRPMRKIIALCTLFFGGSAALFAQSPYESSADFAKYAMKLREQAMLKIEPQVFVPTSSRTSTQRYPWKTNIVTTVFWIGEQPTANNPVPNTKSSWDANWVGSLRRLRYAGRLRSPQLHPGLVRAAAESVLRRASL